MASQHGSSGTMNVSEAVARLAQQIQEQCDSAAAVASLAAQIGLRGYGIISVPIDLRYAESLLAAEYDLDRFLARERLGTGSTAEDFHGLKITTTGKQLYVRRDDAPASRDSESVRGWVAGTYSPFITFGRALSAALGFSFPATASYDSDCSSVALQQQGATAAAPTAERVDAAAITLIMLNGIDDAAILIDGQPVSQQRAPKKAEEVPWKGPRKCSLLAFTGRIFQLRHEHFPAVSYSVRPKRFCLVARIYPPDTFRLNTLCHRTLRPDLSVADAISDLRQGSTQGQAAGSITVVLGDGRHVLPLSGTVHDLHALCGNGNDLVHTLGTHTYVHWLPHSTPLTSFHFKDGATVWATASRSFQVFVRTIFDGSLRTHTIRVLAQETAADLKMRLWERSGVPPDDQSLTHGRQMYGDETLESFGISAESSIHCIARPRGV